MSFSALTTLLDCSFLTGLLFALFREKDNVLPSQEEARRLQKVMSGAKVIIRNFPNSGHALLLVGRLALPVDSP